MRRVAGGGMIGSALQFNDANTYVAVSRATNGGINIDNQSFSLSIWSKLAPGTAGADYFFGSRMYGHDTAYTPSGSGQENPRAGFSYSDADAAVAQPKFTPVFMAGLQFRL